MKHVAGLTGWHYHMNSDLSGDMIVKAPDGSTFNMPATDVLEIAASYVMMRRISMIEQMNTREILGATE